MKLSVLLHSVGLSENDVEDLALTGLCEHNLEVEPGFAYLALADEPTDAARYARDAAERGAAIVFSSHAFSAALKIPVLTIPNLLTLRDQLARNFYADPSAELECVGVTGTNGKTSVAFYIAGLSDLLGVSAGYSGTLGWGKFDALTPADMTTANAVALQRQLARLRDIGCTRVALEISSHALDQHRVDALKLHTGVFTNLSRDHLDYHHSMAAYGAAKRRLFSDWSLQAAVVNRDDAFGETIEEAITNPGTSIQRFGVGGESQWQWHTKPGVTGLDISWQTPDGAYSATVPVLADFSVANLTAAIAVLHGVGHSVGDIVTVLPNISQVPGRLELLPHTPDQPQVVVDYAHTPDALEKALRALQPVCKGRLICVFGCGGDRDTGKRAQMGAVAGELADLSVVTSDNPRSEDPGSIIDQILQGFATDQWQTCIERGKAICRAIQGADAKDIVLIAGKGHEDYQEVAGQRLDFDDRKVALEVLHAAAGLN